MFSLHGAGAKVVTECKKQGSRKVQWETIFRGRAGRGKVQYSECRDGTGIGRSRERNVTKLSCVLWFFCG